MTPTYEQMQGYLNYLAQVFTLPPGTSTEADSYGLSFIKRKAQIMQRGYDQYRDRVLWHYCLEIFQNEFTQGTLPELEQILRDVPGIQSFEAYCQWRKLVLLRSK